MTTKLAPHPLGMTMEATNARDYNRNGTANYSVGGSYALKKVSSTGNLTDARSTAITQERRWHKRRGRRERDVPNAFNQHTHSHNLNDNYVSGHRNYNGLNLGGSIPSSPWVHQLHVAAEQAATERYVMKEERAVHRRRRSFTVKKSSSSNVNCKNGNLQNSNIRTNPNQSDKPLLPKSLLTRSATAPNTLADDALTTRAASIRTHLRQVEIQELALEAERAAEKGMERFRGGVSLFLGDNEDVSGNESRYNGAKSGGGGRQNESRCTYNTPNKDKNAHHDDFLLTPKTSILSKKKLRVTSLREFHEVIPSFNGMHLELRGHFLIRGVKESMLTTTCHHSQAKRLASMTITTPTEEDDVNSQAASQAGSIASFGSYAFSSLRGIVEYVGKKNHPTGSGGNANHSNSTLNRSVDYNKYSNFNDKYSGKSQYSTDQTSHHTASPEGFDSCCGSFEFDAHVEEEQYYSIKNSKKLTNHQPNATTMMTASTLDDDHSDDSSLELYGRASPSSINGVLSGVALDKTRSKQPFLYNNGDHEDEKSLTPSILSHDAAQSVATFISRIQHKFNTRSSPNNNYELTTNNRASNQNKILLNKSRKKQNAKYLSNYFYIPSTPSDLLHNPHEGGITHKLDINPNSHSSSKRDGLCLGMTTGCSNTDVLSGCESVGNAVDTITTWFTERAGNVECDPSRGKNTKKYVGENQIVLQHHHGWIRNWQDGNENRRAYMPPKLAVRGFR